ncbi:O-linked N-acetylglucosamine transferase, SPINDLY family protein [Oryzibacter oryziterrae]|uniref:O-linked N-acetylglucosamine transferase, SPINDLY family protein n=1 Tax=Oryzibacter oryziterrae TaxID=2766474 RepID=UPI001F3AB531|nr:glycosyl transferase [Oryzibacter oryziterrae]
MASDGAFSPNSPAGEQKIGVLDLIRAADKLKLVGEPKAAETLYAGWIQSNPNDPLLYAVLFNYAVMLTDAGAFDAARQAFERSIELKDDFMPSYINLGRVFERMGAAGQGILRWSAGTEKLAQVNGTAIGFKTTLLNQIGRTLESVSQDVAAEDALRQSLDIDPTQREVAQHFLALRQRQCEWPVVVPTERISRAALMKGLSPLSMAAYTDDPMLQLAASWFYNKQDVGLPPTIATAWPKAFAHTGKLRVGYLSSDLREHAVGHLMAEVLGLHDREAVEVFAYYCGIPSDDPMNRAFKAQTDHWIDVSGLDDATAAQRMIDDGIQILVDVNGYTREGRTKLIARRPAPVIVNWLGYPGTVASPYHHYIVADEWIIPPDHEIHYSEQVLRLPCYQPTNRQRIVAPETPSRAEVGLPDDAFVFCCFNGSHKITRFTFERWMRILNGVPGSVLWLLSSGEASDTRLREHAVRLGLDGGRIVFAPKKPNPQHLARYVLADLFLDTTPYGAHTTCSDALWMGVPVLTLSGRSFASRVCGSLVRSAGLPEMVTEDAEVFVARAIALAQAPDELSALRDRLKAGRDACVLFDTPLLVRSLEDLYGQMWQAALDGALPQPDLRNLDDYLEVGLEFDHEAREVQLIADYEGWWRSALAERHAKRAIPFDGRLWRESFGT